ncbi:hypothetical protein SUGI_0069650 [Cryptomeria japonica]|nr:hypothetical protein SUGI_0069650 [Cryptomeria japonica]
MPLAMHQFEQASPCCTAQTTDNFTEANMAGALRLTVGSSAEQVECRDELITDILSRVSTGDLLKMCTVVKRWRTLIFDPGFAYTHHNNCNRQSLFIFSEQIRVPKPIAPWWKGKTYDTKYGSFQFRSHNRQMDNLSNIPLSLESIDIDINGRTSEEIASNGVLCFLTFTVLGNLEFLFYNPVTKFEKKLTVSLDMHLGMDFPSFFGFCCTQNTKKLVVGGRRYENETYTLVFDSQSNSWYKGPPPFRYITEDFDHLQDPLFFNGVIYFLVRTPTINTQEGEEPRDIDAVFRDENDLFYMIIGYDVNQDQWCFSVFIPTSVGYPYCLIEWDGKLLVLASNSTHEDNLFVLAASSTHDPKQKIRYGLDEGDGHFVFWILDTQHKLWTRERELDLSHEFHSFWAVSASGGVVWLTSGYNSVIVYHMKNGHCSTHRLDALSWRKQNYICVSLEPTLLSF